MNFETCLANIVEGSLHEVQGKGLAPVQTGRDCRRGVGTLRSITHRTGAMRDPAYELPRTPVLGTSVNEPAVPAPVDTYLLGAPESRAEQDQDREEFQPSQEHED